VLFAYYQKRLATEVAKPKNQLRLARNRAELETTLKAARKNGVLVFLSAGNGFEAGASASSRAEYSRDAASVPGMMVVGATDSRTGKLADWSSVGANITMPGTEVPVGARRPNGIATTDEGDSLSAPDAAALAALMIKAGLTNVDEIEAVLMSHTISHPIGGASANATLKPDEVAAVVAAAERSRPSASCAARIPVRPEGSRR
jgi:hypothetical protein